MAANSERNKKDDGRGISCASDFRKINGREIPGLLNKNAISVYFQPIFSAKDGTIYGYEALTRIEGENSSVAASKLFRKAKRIHAVSSLDYLYLATVVRRAADLGLTQQDIFLCINVCPDTLTSPVYKIDEIGGLIERWGMVKEKIVFEVKVESVIRNYDFLKQAITYYKNSGYLIAIDDFRASYKGLKMLSFIEPDIIKIDRQFLDKMRINFSFVYRIVSVCQRIGIKVIATGIEKEEEIEDVLTMGIELLQGNHLGKPFSLTSGELSTIPERQRKNKESARKGVRCK